MFTPHARGSTSGFIYDVRGDDVYPACAGIDPLSYFSSLLIQSLPRMRGDRPFFGIVFSQFLQFTPHARGSTSCGNRFTFLPDVYPACAGIDRVRPVCGLWYIRLPRMRGDRPRLVRMMESGEEFTPHARGSTSAGARTVMVQVVYPACAGIDPGRTGRKGARARLPRMRGDRPWTNYVENSNKKFTPHARGSTHVHRQGQLLIAVYPACAGIDRTRGFEKTWRDGLPRMRGDRP